MNVTFLIGNGFDLNLGLKTKYGDFIKTYCAENDKDSDLIKAFKKNIHKNPDLWASAELAFGQYTTDFSGDNAAIEFSQCYDDFRIKLADYLTNEERSFSIDESKNKFGKALIKWSESFRAETRAQIAEASKNCVDGIYYNFITYNYTDVLDQYVQYAKVNADLGERIVHNTRYKNQIGSIIHVHGTVNKDMVMGVDNISQIKKPEIFENVEAEYLDDIIKVNNNRMCEENTDVRAHNMLKGSDFLYIYGMSLGETDATWWSRICEIMKNKKNLLLIIYSYDAPEEELLRRRRVTFDNNVRRTFTKYCDYEPEIKQEIERRIIIQNQNLFKSLSPEADMKNV